jgi:hypothetical protein
MNELKLPSFEYKVRKEADKTYIFDLLRKKYVVLTPEEWVRQHIVHFLIANKYPKSLMKLEQGTSYNKLQKRTDLRVYTPDGNLFMLVECKAPEVKITKEVSLQAATYANTLNPKYIFLSNGIEHFIFEMNYKTGENVAQNQLPLFS